MLCGQPVFCYRLGFIGLMQPLQLLVLISPLSHLKSGGLLDKDKGRVAAPNRMNFRKSAKGGGAIFNPKVYVTDFGNFKQGFLIMKLIQNSNFRVQGMFFQQLH